MYGTVWCGIVEMILCSVWEFFVLVSGSEFVLRVGEFVVGLWLVSVCCVWD